MSFKPSYSDSEEEEFEYLMRRSVEESESEDEMRTLSFGSLKKASQMLEEEEAPKKKSTKKAPKKKVESDSEDEFFEQEEKKGKNKHAPTEVSFKKRPPKVRQIPGLETRKSELYQDIRFNKAFGQAEDIESVRRNYRFLDEYREKEIKDMERILRDKKLVNKMPQDEVEHMRTTLTSMKSKLQTIKNRDLEKKILKEYSDKINAGNKKTFHLKESDKRKVIQKWKFDNLKASQRDKMVERKRKRKLGREFKMFERGV